MNNEPLSVDLKNHINLFYKVYISHFLTIKSLKPLSSDAKESVENFKKMNSKIFDKNQKELEFLNPVTDKFLRILRNARNVYDTFFYQGSMHFIQSIILMESFKNTILIKFLYLNENKLKKLIKSTPKEELDSAKWEIYFDKTSKESHKIKVLNEFVETISRGGYIDRIKNLTKLNIKTPPSIQKVMEILNSIRNDIVHSNSIIQNNTYNEIEKFYKDYIDNEDRKDYLITTDVKVFFEKILKENDPKSDRNSSLKISRVNFQGLFHLILADFLFTSVCIINLSEKDFDYENNIVETDSSNESLIEFINSFIYDGSANFYVNSFKKFDNDFDESFGYELLDIHFHLKFVYQLIRNSFYDSEGNLKLKIDRGNSNILNVNLLMLKSFLGETVKDLERIKKADKDVLSIFSKVSKAFNKYTLKIKDDVLFTNIEYNENRDFSEERFGIAKDLLTKKYGSVLIKLDRCENLEKSDISGVMSWHLSKDFRQSKEFLSFARNHQVILPQEEDLDLSSYEDIIKGLA